MPRMKPLAAMAVAGAIALSAAATAQMGPMRGGAGGPRGGPDHLMGRMSQHMQEHMALHRMMGPRGSGMMGHGPMGVGMMDHEPMRYGMMGHGPMGPQMGGPGGPEWTFGARVLPRMNLTVDDVRYHFEQVLEWLGNDRLKVGSVKEKDKDTITAEIVTVDDSLVQALEVDRHTGAIDPGK